MKIWMINHYATPPEWGSSTRHYTLAKELKKYGHEVTVIASSGQHLLKSKPPKGTHSLEIWRDKYVKFLLLPSPDYQGNGIRRLWNMLYFAGQVLQLPKEIKEQPDVIIGSSVHPFAVWAAEYLAARYQIPFCFEVRDLWPQTLIDMKAISKYHPLTFILSKLEAYLYRKANRIITLLPYAYEYISKFNIPPSKIAYLPNGVDLNLFPTVALPQEPQEQLTVMYLGSHGPANGLDTLVAAAAELETKPASKPILWRLIGEGSQKSQLQAKIEQLNLESIKLEDGVPKSEVPQIISEADIFIFHLLDIDVFRYGVSPNKLFDYLASQRPIVFGCAARNNPVSESGAGITVPPQNPQAMAEAIRQIAALSLAERSEMAKRGRAYVEQHHSYHHLGDKLNNLLKEVVSH
ncbi:MAG: glycosyltransferase family 4 protein [Symploca sp. SIO1A3]|nr:glycosyltransferase family 4 protein [Symploca sp. SIO1A3]